MPYIGNITSDFSIDTGNITNRAVTATKLSPSSVGSNGQVLSVDGSGNLQWGNDANAPEGTAVLSTGESGTTKFLRIDGDGTCSWQVPPNTQLSFSNDANNRVVTGTGSGLNGEANLTFNGISLGIGVSASTFSLGNALQIEGAGVGVWGENTSTIHLFSNAYYDGGYKYGVTAPAGQYQIYQNTHQWAIAASGTADAALTWVPAMKIDSSGRLLIGTTTEGNESADELTINSTTNTGITIRSGENHNGSIFFSDTTSGADEYRGFVQYDQQNDNLKLGCGTEAIVWLHLNKKLSVGADADTYGQWAFLNIGSSGADATGGDKGLCIRSDTGPTNNSVLSNSAFTLKLNNNGYAGTGVSGNTGTVVKLLFNGVTSNGWNSYGAIGLDTQGTSGSKGDLFFNTGGTTDGEERMRIKYTGKVGIGTTSPESILDVMGDQGYADSASTLATAVSKSAFRVRGSNDSSDSLWMGVETTDANPYIQGANGIGSNEKKLLLNPFGENVGIGTTSPGQKLHIYEAAGDSQCYLKIQNNRSRNAAVMFTTTNGSWYAGQGIGADVDRFMIYDSTPRFEIFSTGCVGINGVNCNQFSEKFQVKTNEAAGYGIAIRHTHDSAGSLMRFSTFDGSNEELCGSVTGSGTSTSFNESSDYRLKENEVAISDGITRLKLLKPYRFNWKAETSKTVDGFFAHEVTPAVPEAVWGTKDATEVTYWTEDEKDNLPEGKEVGDVKNPSVIVPQQLDKSKLVPLITAALKEAIAKIETLETKVAALETA